MTRSASRSAGHSKKSDGQPPTGARVSTKAKSQKPKLSSRAVLREVEPGSGVECVHCGERVKFQAKMRHKQVICNVYVGRRWDRVEHFHESCYDEADMPHGEVDTTPPVRRRSSSVADKDAGRQREAS